MLFNFRIHFRRFIFIHVLIECRVSCIVMKNCTRKRKKRSDQEDPGTLIGAARKGDVAVVKEWLNAVTQQRRLNLENNIQTMERALIKAAKNGHAAVVQVLLEDGHVVADTTGFSDDEVRSAQNMECRPCELDLLYEFALG